MWGMGDIEDRDTHNIFPKTRNALRQRREKTTGLLLEFGKECRNTRNRGLQLNLNKIQEKTTRKRARQGNKRSWEHVQRGQQEKRLGERGLGGPALVAVTAVVSVAAETDQHPPRADLAHQPAPVMCRTCTEPLLHAHGACTQCAHGLQSRCWNRIHTKPRKTYSREWGYCSSATMKCEFEQPRTMQNSEFTSVSVCLLVWTEGHFWYVDMPVYMCHSDSCRSTTLSA